MNPITLAQAIPTKVRQAIYSLLATSFAIEAVLDGVGEGLVDEKAQGIVLGILAVLGFGMARANAPTPDPED